MTPYALGLVDYLEDRGFGRLEAEMYLDENGREDWREAEPIEGDLFTELDFSGDDSED